MNFEKYYIDSKQQEDTEFPFELVGEYRTGYSKYKLELNNTFSHSLYYCMGGRWSVSESGSYSVLEGNKVQLSYKQRCKEDDFLLFDCDSNGRLGLNNIPSLSSEFNEYSKLDYPSAFICIDDAAYPEALKRDNKYVVIDEKRDLYRVIGENKKIRWYPKECFKEISSNNHKP